MQVSRRTGDGDLGEGQPAQEGGDGGRVGVPLPGIANERDVGLELLAMGGEEGREARASRFFLALDEHADVDGKLAMLVEPGAARPR